MFKKFLKSKLQKGQSMIFMAISIPILFAMIGAAADFGWLYLNQSRLQNAADAAAFAGAQKLLERDVSSLSTTYRKVKLISNYDEDLARLVNEHVISSADTSEGDIIAKKYAKLNLSGWLGDENLKVVDIGPARGTFTVNDTEPNEWGTVKFKHLLYGKDEEDYKTLYYTVILTEKLDHIFKDIMDYFGFMNLNSKAVAVARISIYRQKPNTPDDPNDPNDPNSPINGDSLYKQMVSLRNSMVFADWWQIKREYTASIDTDKMRNTYKISSEYFDSNGDIKSDKKDRVTTLLARMLSVQAKGNEYVDGNFYRTETLTLHGYSKAATGGGGEDGVVMDQRNFDSLFCDLKVDRSEKDMKDTDPGSNRTVYNLKTNSNVIESTDTFSKSGLTGEEVWKLRIHDLINVGRWNGSIYEPTYDYPYKVRYSDNETYDPLYVKIESEDNYVDTGSGRNTVRQFIININATNTASNDRPMFLFYDGPQLYSGKNQARWEEDWRESWKHLVSDDVANSRNNIDDSIDYVLDSQYMTENPANGTLLTSSKRNLRKSLPVIINFYQNFRGVFFFPNSPVVINGNRKNFEGFVIAQKFLRLKQAADFPDKAENPSGYYYFKDDRGNEYYKNDDDLVYYHKKAEGGTRYIQIITVTKSNGEKVIRYRNVVYAKGPVLDAHKDPFNGDDITLSDSIYVDPNGKCVVLSPSTSDILYTYTWMNQEKSNLTKAFVGAGKYYEKEYVHVNPMYIDEMGNVQYAALGDDYKLPVRPTPIVSQHYGYVSGNENYNLIDDQNEIIFDWSNRYVFNFNSVRYNGYDQIILANYTKLNDSSRNVYDAFYTTIRSDWIK